MKKLIIFLFIGTLLCFPTLITEIKPQNTPKTLPIALKTPKTRVITKKAISLTSKEKITEIADKYDVSQETMNKIIACESGYNPKAVGDGGKSFGLAQIHLPSHPNITKEQALNEDFALDFLGKNLASGKGNMWSCFRNQKVV